MNRTGSRRPQGALVVVGTGIALAGQATLEAVDCMRRADTLFYATPNPATEVWIRRINPSASTLQDCYAEGKPRDRTYREMSDRILSAVRAGRQVCAVFYGHPGVFVQPSHDAIRRARREGFSARMLPGVSAEACLFADLGVDPGEVGCQSFEATDFLASRRRFDPTSVLILWQVGMLGEPSIREGMEGRTDRLRVLTAALRRHYPARHRLVLYEASQFPVSEPIVMRIRLSALPATPVLPMTTIYVPPLQSRSLDPRIMEWFDDG